MARRPSDDVRPGAHRRRVRSCGLAQVWATLVTLAVPAAACKSGPDLSLDYAQSARENYELALGEFGDEDWDEAIQYADFVRIRFPFSRYAVEAELLIARSEFHQGNYLTAQDAFRQFAKLHPTHKHVRNGWVSYMAAVSAYMNGPQGFFLLPPAPQRDQSQLKEALAELEYFFDHYADTPSTKYAIELRDEIKRRLLDHELYVANFYLDRDRPEAAIGRLEAAHQNYPGIGLDAEVLFLLGITYLRLDEVELARATFTELQNQHPRHHRGRQARVYLRYIYDTYGPADPARPRPDRSPPVPKPPARPKNKARPEVPLNTPPSTERRVGTGSRTTPAGRKPAQGKPETAPPEGSEPARPPPTEKGSAPETAPQTEAGSEPESEPEAPEAAEEAEESEDPAAPPAAAVQPGESGGGGGS